MIGSAQGGFDQTYDEKVRNELAWWLVSCQRGFDCTPDADWIQLGCTDDRYCKQGITGMELIRDASADDWPNVAQRAQEISAKLDSGQWDELGF